VPATLRTFMLPEDERSFLRLLARHELTVWPEVIPPGYDAPRAVEELLDRLDLGAYYLAAERFGKVVVHPVKRGRDKGMWEIEEVPSPVFHWERSARNDAGELLGGRIWAELVITDDPRSRLGKPTGLKAIFDEVHAFFRKAWRRSDPQGWWVGPRAAAAARSEGLVLRAPGHKGRTVRVWR
jgi:hypothetical protein